MWRRLTEQILDYELVLATQHSERVPTRLARWYRVRFDPAATRVLVEVVARVDAVVQRLQQGACCRDALPCHAHRLSTAYNTTASMSV